MTLTVETTSTPIAVGAHTATARPTVLTPKGHCVVAFYRSLQLLRELGADDRAAVLELLALELEVEPPAE
jgi:hypothetical protein